MNLSITGNINLDDLLRGKNMNQSKCKMLMLKFGVSRQMVFENSLYYSCNVQLFD